MVGCPSRPIFFSAWRGIADRYKKGLVFLLRPARATQIQRQKNEAHGKRLGTRCPKNDRMGDQGTSRVRSRCLFLFSFFYFF